MPRTVFWGHAEVLPIGELSHMLGADVEVGGKYALGFVCA